MKVGTTRPLAAARRIYLSRGFKLVEEEPHHSFGVDLVGQVYQLDLRPGLAARCAERASGWPAPRGAAQDEDRGDVTQHRYPARHAHPHRRPLLPATPHAAPN